MSNIIYTPFLNYLRIVADAHEKMVQYIDDTGATCLDPDHFHHSAAGQATIVVLYTTISLECYIFNYATRKLGETFCKKHIDAMNLHTKWLVVPKLATGAGIPSDHIGIALLQKLIKARNGVAHAKAVNIVPERWEQQKEKIVEGDNLILEAAVKAFRCVGELGSALRELDPHEPSAELLARLLDLPEYSVARRAKS